jgi:hypothetical protein
MGSTMSELDDLVAAARAAAQRRGATDVERGLLDGLLQDGLARLTAQPAESVHHHAGYLGGHLMRWLHEHGKSLETSTLLIASLYGGCLADEGGQKQLARPDRPVTAHLYAAIRTEKRSSTAIDEADERMLLGWLLDQTDTAATPQLLAKVERLRARRLERTGFLPQPPES